MLTMRTDGKRIALVLAATLIAVALLSACEPSREVQRAPVVVNTSFPDRDTAGLARAADMIVVGTVKQVLSPTKGTRVTAQARERLLTKGVTAEEIDDMTDQFSQWVYTSLVLNVERTVKGSAPNGIVTFRTAGGSVDGYEFQASGYPSFSEGERVLVCLGESFDGALDVIAVYRIDGESAVSKDLGHTDETTLPALIAELNEHKNEADPLAAPQ